MTRDSQNKLSASAYAEDVTLTVPALREALDFFTQRLGFRVDMIVPADAPQVALLSGQGIRLRLVISEAHCAQTDSLTGASGFVISRLCDEEMWHAGRAGMQYRDLIPGRPGGRVIASHIRIPEGGEVPDYVHYHKVHFQMIYCRAGWVRVVYEHQGPPFVMEAGDCVLQPPEIRHRVLEASPGLEVIEIGCPAIHETWADHELELPSRQILPERLFNQQRFVRHIVRDALWKPWHSDGFVARDTGIAAATNGLAAVRVVKANVTVTAAAKPHADKFLFLFVLNGELSIDSPPEENHSLQAGDSCVIPANVAYTLHAGAALEFLEVSLPADLPLTGTDLCPGD